ncbi:hypothetical protein F5887DRAFT_951179 [Amanita rubescens]|nr:hypothetical protein F5887DRAFT_951179 [Amanita rubescens]
MATAAPTTLDKSLDDIISSKRTTRRVTARTRRTSARSSVLGSTAISPTTRVRAAAAAAASNSPADKIIVSNLPADVNEVQIKLDPLKDVTLHHDSAGRSKGVASVHFTRKGDGTKAYQQYNNRLIDGKRPMKIEIVVDPTKSAPSLVSRVAPPAAAAGASTARTAGGRPRRGRGGGGGRSKKTERPAKSAADLDAEMEDYTAHSAPGAAA